MVLVVLTHIQVKQKGKSLSNKLIKGFIRGSQAEQAGNHSTATLF